MSAAEELPVVIVGGGPAGLSLAAHLCEAKIETLVLERGRVAESWWHYPPTMRLLSPWWTNVLETRDAFKRSPFAIVAASIYREYLLAYAARRRLPVRERSDIVALQPESGRWRLHSGSGEAWSAACVVLATGYFSAPREPRPGFESDHSIPVVHAARVEDYDAFAAAHRGRTVVLVGKRVSAGQLMVELYRRGVRIVLSARRPIRFRRGDAIGRLRDQLYFFWEWLRIRAQPRLKANSFPVMDGGETEALLGDGRVPLVGPIRSIAAGHVHTVDGERFPADLILLATGYRPALSLLEGWVSLDPESGLPAMDGFRVRDYPGLYLLGFDHLYNFRSRYLRGIRADAARLARELKRRLA